MPARKSRANVHKNWGIYTYIAGDNNLSDFGLQDIEEMAKAGASAGLSIWFPLVRTDYVTRRSEYVALRYSKDYPYWAKFLDVHLAG